MVCTWTLRAYSGWPMRQQVGESLERGVLAVDRLVVAMVSTECNKECVYWLVWEINPVSGGNIVTYGHGSTLSTLTVTVLLLRGLWTGSTSQTVHVQLGRFQITRQRHQKIARRRRRRELGPLSKPILNN